MNELEHKQTILNLYELYKKHFLIETETQKSLLKDLQMMKERAKEMETLEQQKEHLDKMFKIQRLLIEDENQQYFAGAFSLAIKLTIDALSI